VRRHAFPEQRHQLGIEEAIVILDIQGDGAADRGMLGERTCERRALQVVHDEHHVGPVEHQFVDLHARVGTGAGRANVESRFLAENALRRRAAHLVVAADEKHPNRTVC